MNRVRTGALIGLLTVGDVAAAEPPLTSRDVVVATRGTLGGRYYPEVAQKAAAEGAAEVVCRISASHDLEACRVLWETPAGCGFGDAVLRFASDLQLSPRKRSGAPIAGRDFSFKMQFRLPGKAPKGPAKTCAQAAGELAPKAP